jgi:hypothetical protein
MAAIERRLNSAIAVGQALTPRGVFLYTPPSRAG